MRIFFIIFTLLLSKAFAVESTIENSFNMKTGLAFSRIHFKSGLIPNNQKTEDHSESSGFGFNTSVGYRFTSIELLAVSDVFFGKLKDLRFKVPNGEVRGNGSFRVFSLGPQVKYYTPYLIAKRWNVFTSAGPTWSLHTFIISNNLNGSTFTDKERISFQNVGGTISIGLEEVVPFKETHPVFFEVAYSYMKSTKVFIVDASDFKDVKTLSSGPSSDFYGSYLVFRAGITLF